MMAPNYNILLQPRCSDGTALSKLHVTVTLESPERKKLQQLFCLKPLHGQLPYPYATSNTQAADEGGPLEISFETSENGSLKCTVGRDTVGDVVLSVVVTPKATTIDEKSTLPPLLYTELHCDQGGLLGVGRWFLPQIPYRERSTFIINWDLSLAPPGTRASWSYGEGGTQSIKSGPNDMLLGAVFMVGPIISFTGQETATGDPNISGNMDIPSIHWFGDLPPCLEPMKKYNANIFLYTRTSFQDPNATSKVYIRKVPRQFTAGNFSASYIIQYSDQHKPHHAAQLVQFMTHEMVHNWVWLGDEPDGYQNFWFIEGIAEFYALYLPIRAGVMGIEYFCQVLDEFLTAYYTSPLIQTPLRDQPSDASGISLPYERGFMYFFVLEGQLRHASRTKAKVTSDITHQSNILDSIIISIVDKSYADELTNANIWRQTLYPLLGQDTVDTHFSLMLEGGRLIPNNTEPIIAIAGKQVRLQIVKQERLDIGFQYRSLDTGVVDGLVPGSRAEAAGLRNGDKILAHGSRPACKGNFGCDYWYNIQRGEEKLEIAYWPRSYTKVTSYQTVIVQE